MKCEKKEQNRGENGGGGVREGVLKRG